jgi:sucrose phosphorylase
MERIGDRLARLYGEERRSRLLERIGLLAGRYGVGVCHDEHCGGSLWDERDAIVIAYGDMVRREGEAPLQTLLGFMDTYLHEALSGVHILPFFPYSSDDGFSVIDFRQVDPHLGDWDAIQAISADYRLMTDLVLNHVSSRSAWFKGFTNGLAPERDYFIVMDPDSDLSAVVRPRNLPLLTAAQTPAGERHVWTTFSADQVDLDFANPDVLFEILDILCLYVNKGARIVRLDAIAYLWKEPGTSCVHLPQTHEVVKLMRDVLEMLAPGVILLTETNVPHNENVSYFGDGDEAHMVYQFSLPPLLLHALHSGNTRYLTTWAATLEPPPAGCTYFNFTASHDGIGVRPLEGLLPQSELDTLAEGMKQRGGQVSMRARSDGSESPYELNITYFDALSDPGQAESGLHIARFLCSQTIMLGLQGIPGIYFNSLVGGRNNTVGMQTTGQARTINRQKWDAGTLSQQLEDSASSAHRVFSEYLHRLRLRRMRPAFHPDAPQRVLALPDGLFGFMRTSREGNEQLLSLSNLQSSARQINIERAFPEFSGQVWTELIEGREIDGSAVTRLRLAPYQTLWLLNSSNQN